MHSVRPIQWNRQWIRFWMASMNHVIRIRGAIPIQKVRQLAEPCCMRMDYSYTAIMPQILQVEDYAMHLIWSGSISFMNLIMDQRKERRSQGFHPFLQCVSLRWNSQMLRKSLLQNDMNVHSLNFHRIYQKRILTGWKS